MVWPNPKDINCYPCRVDKVHLWHDNGQPTGVSYREYAYKRYGEVVTEENGNHQDSASVVRDNG